MSTCEIQRKRRSVAGVSTKSILNNINKTYIGDRPKMKKRSDGKYLGYFQMLNYGPAIFLASFAVNKIPKQSFQAIENRQFEASKIYNRNFSENVE